MRLTIKEIDAIKKTFYEIFGEGKIYLFGSRVYDNKRGGDIDLFIISNKRDLKSKKIKFVNELTKKIGDQKIDVLISRDLKRTIEQEALKEGILLNKKELKIKNYLNECDKHLLRIEQAYAKVKNLLPLSGNQYKNLSDENITYIDQYLFRFSKLQDTIGSNLFRLVVSDFVEDIEKMTFLDILNRLEKIGIIEDVNIWRELRIARNNISHQYEDDPEEMAEALNKIFAQKNEIKDIYLKIKDYFNENL